MDFKRIILVFLLGLVFATSTWAVPQQWGVFVPTGAQYLGSRSGAIGKEWGCSDCNGYDREGIDHISWFCCGACIYCPGYLCTDAPAFDKYQVTGDYYDCEGDLLERGVPWGSLWLIINGTGTIYSGAIGGRDNNGYVVDCVTTWCSPARDCRIYQDTSPQLGYCPGGLYPYIGSPYPHKNLGRPRGVCDGPQLVGNPINVATGNKYEEVLDLVLSTPGIPLEFRRSYNSQSDYEGPLGYGWTHNFNLRLQEIEESLLRRIILWDEDGRALYFHQVRKEAGSEDIPFAGESGVKDRLWEIALTGEYLFRRKDTNLSYLFSPEGRLIEIFDPNGNRLTLTYQGAILSQVSNNFDKTLLIQYNEEGRIKVVKDPKGQSVLYEYRNGDLTKVIYPDRNSLSYTYLNHNLTDKYDTQRNLIGHWDYNPRDRVKTYYSHLKDNAPQNWIDLTYGFLKTEVTDTRGTTTYSLQMIQGVSLVKEIKGCSSCGSLHKKLNYNRRLDLESITSVIDGEEITTRYTYDNPPISWMQVGEITEKVEAEGYEEERGTFYTYTHRPEDPFLLTEKTERKASVLVADQGRVTTWKYNDAGNPISREETGYTLINEIPTLKTYKTEYGYNALGQLTSIDGPRTDVSDLTTLEYYENTSSQKDNRGQLRAIINALGQRVEYSDYDPNGNVKKIKGPNEVVTQYSYDERNRIKTITNTITRAKTQYFYDSHGNLSLVIFPEGNELELTYDPANHLTDIKDNLGNTIHYEYDQEGNRAREERRDPKGELKKYLDFAYDPYNRLWKIINPDKTFTEYTYDGNGNIKTLKDPRDNLTLYTYDPLNRQREMRQLAKPEDILTNYEYDSHDNLIMITDGNRNTTDYFYDDFRRLNQTISPDTGKTVYLYDEALNLIQKTDQRGAITTYTYDALNRPKAINFSQDSSQDILYTYDSPLVSYGIGRLTGRTDSSGTYIFHYDAQGNLVKEEKEIESILYTTKYSYNKNNNLTSVTYPSKRKVTYTLDAIENVSKVASTFNYKTKTLASGIEYLPYGGKRRLTYGNNLPLNQEHDQQYRIYSIIAGSVLNRNYGHDPNGNIISITDALHPDENQTQERPETYTYEPKSNRLSQVIGERPITFLYDPNGNTVSENTRTFEYDYSNRLTRAKENDTIIVEYVYNGAGQRTIKTTPNEIRIFHYDHLGHLIAETGENGQAIAEYVYLGDQLLAMMREGNTYYYHNDHLGTPQVLTDSTGKVVWEADYNAFGETEILLEEVENPFRFPGQYYDKETGLHYNYFRDYNPRIGRYMTPDPIGLEGGVNLFAYVANNPTNWVDPEGLAIYIKIPTRDEYEEKLSSFGLGGLPNWLKDAMYESYKNPGPADMMGGIGFGGRATAKICLSGKFIQRAKEALGIFPTKIGGGGKLQPYSELTGRYVPETKTIANKIYSALNSASVSFATGVLQGYASSSSGVDLPVAINKPQSWGQWIGNIVGSIVERL